MARPIVLVGGNRIIPTREDLESAPWGRFASGKPGRDKGEKAVAAPSFFQVDDNYPKTGPPAIAMDGHWFKDNGGFRQPYNADDGYTGPPWAWNVSFWIRFTKQLVVDFTSYAVSIVRHDSSDQQMGVGFRRSATTPRVSFKYARQSPYLNADTWACPASALSTMMASDGSVILDKWFWMYFQCGLLERCMVLTEDYDENVPPTWITDNASPIEMNGWAEGTGTEARLVIGSDLDVVVSPLLSEATPRMDFCNLRLGYRHAYTADWWEKKCWKRHVDVLAERALMLDQLSVAETKRSISYAFPLQENYEEQNSNCIDLTEYSGDLVSGVGPELFPAYAP